MAIGTFAELKTAIASHMQGRSDLSARIPEFVSLAEDRIAQDVRIRAMETQGRLIWVPDVDGGTVGGTANAITLSAVGTPAYGDSYTFTATATNTTAVTINGTSLKNRFGGVKEAVGAGAILDDESYRIYYDGTDFLLAPLYGALLPVDYLEMRSKSVDTAGRRLEFVSPDIFRSTFSDGNSGSAKIATIEGDWVLAWPTPDARTRSFFDYYRRFTALSGDSDTNWLLQNARGIYLYGSLIAAAPFIGEGADALQWATLYDEAVEALNTADRRAQFPVGTTMRTTRWTP